MRATRSTTRAGVAALLVTAVTAAGCAATRESPAMPSSATPPPPPAGSPEPPLSSTQLPTREPPARPPKTPTDLVPADVIAGRVTRGGSGPCYGVITDDGTEYAVYSGARPALRAGTWVRIRFEPLQRTIDCGPGRPVAAVEITVLS